MVCRCVGIEQLMEHMNDDIVSSQGSLYPHQFMYDPLTSYNLIPPSYLSWRADVRGKKFLLDYISANASTINHISIEETIAYLLGALEIEKGGSPWFNMTLKTLADLLFVKSFESYALSTGTCLFEAINHQYQTFACSAIPVLKYN